MPFIKPTTTRSIIHGALYRGIQGDLIMVPSLLINTNIVVHYHPINDSIGDLNSGWQQSWTISQLVRKNNKTLRLQPLLLQCAPGGIRGKQQASDLATEIAKVFTDDRIEWQDSIQLSRLNKLMRALDPHMYCRWGEKWQYKPEWASRILPHVKSHQLPTYTVSVRYKLDDKFFYVWGKYEGQWDRTILGLETERISEQVHQVSR